MPSEKVLESKKQQVAALTDELKSAVSGVIVSYKGINVANDTALRKELREAGVNYKVVKNTLLRRAASEVGFDGLYDSLKGSTAIAMSKEDHVAPAKILHKYAEKSKNFDIKAGFIDGKILELSEITVLAELPSKDELVAKAVGGLNAPIYGFASVLSANLRGLVVALNAIASKQA